MAVRGFFLSCGLLLAAASTGMAGVVYDASADFSATNDPNGVWSYGDETSLGGSLTLYPDRVNQSGLDFWQTVPSGDHPPYVAHNGTASAIFFDGFLPYPAGRLGLHPGPAGEYSVVRFTAPQAMTLSIGGSFFNIDPGATTDVHVLLDGVSIFDGAINGSSTAPFSLTRSVLAGDTIDFAVGRGSNGTYFSDSTGLDAQITSTVPEPSGWALLGGAALWGLARARRPRRR